MRRRSAETSKSVGLVSKSSEDSRLGSSSAVRDRWVVPLWKLLFLRSPFFCKVEIRSPEIRWQRGITMKRASPNPLNLQDLLNLERWWFKSQKTISSSHNVCMCMSLSSTNSWGKSEEIKYPKINTSFGNNSSLWWCVGDKWTKPSWKLPFIDSQFCVKWKFLLLISEGRVNSVKSVSLNPPNFQDLLNLELWLKS